MAFTRRRFVQATGMQGEREVWKMDLPFTRAHNESFVKMLLEHGVAVLDRPPKVK